VVENPKSVLVYGDAGVGKTYLGVSSFWDPRKLEKIREGRWLLIGREDNDALGVPEEMIRRFVSPKEQPMKFANDFATYVEALVAQSRKGNGLDAIFVDGWSEWNHLLLWEFDKSGQSQSQWDAFDQAKDRFFSAIQMLHPRELGAHIIATARVDEKRKGVFNKRTGELTGADPDYINFKYVPAMVGWAKKNMAHYYDLVVYAEAEPGDIKVGGKIRKGIHHNYYVLPSGDFLVKNRWEHRALAAGLPDHLTNATFDSLLEYIDKATTVKPAPETQDADGKKN
jgi:hypothetical protein